jgi:cyclic beta-1,2-glucan synthetase
MTSALLLQAQADELLAAAERNAWDGAWYRRAYYDDGAPLGSSTNREARLDSLAQSWAVLAGGDPARARRAMEAVLSQLVWNSQTRRRARQAAELGLLTIGFADGSPGIGSGSAGSHSGSAEAEPHAAAAEPGLVCLFWPPFDRTHRDPGYIKGYPPGVRENGGQYSHAAAWVGWAFAEMGEGDRAYGVFRALNPICRSASTEAAEIYAVEPYVTAADVYSFPPHLARGGWTWYTGSAGWTYRLGLEGILGIRRKGAALDLRPCVPPEWKAWEVTYRYGASRWRIRFENPGGASGGVESIAVDGRPLEGSVVPLADDGREHEVSVRLGRADTGAERRR